MLFQGNAVWIMASFLIKDFLRKENHKYIWYVSQIPKDDKRIFVALYLLKRHRNKSFFQSFFILSLTLSENIVKYFSIWHNILFLLKLTLIIALFPVKTLINKWQQFFFFGLKANYYSKIHIVSSDNEISH